MLALLLIFIIVIMSIPLYLDYKKNPENNILVNNLKVINENQHVSKLIAPIIPHAKKYGFNELFIVPTLVCVLFILLIIIF